MSKNSNVYSFPSHFVNPAEKGEDWIAQMVNAIYTEWGTQSIHSFEKGADRYRLNRLYSLGKQPIDIYKPMFELADDENSSYINLDYSPLPVIPKFRRITNNRFSKIDFDILAQAIDPYALDEKSEYEATERANIKVREMLDELGIDTEVLNSGEVDQPMDEEELSIKMEFGYKHNQAIDLEKRIDAVYAHENIKEKIAQTRDYGFTDGVWAMKVSTDQRTGKVTIRAVDPSQLIVSPTNDPYFRDIWYAGETILMTISDVREMAKATGVALNEDALEDLAAKNAGLNGNPKNYAGRAIGAYAYDSCRVPVFDVEFLSCNRFWYEKRWDKRGNPVLGRTDKPKNKQGREYYNDDRSVVYRAKWVPGTTVLFDYGLKNDVPLRQEGNSWEAQLSYKIVAPELNGMETSPIIENIIPIADQICIAWYKLQNVIARAIPKGIMIEIGALEDISLGGGGEKPMRPIDVLDMFTQTGILVYRKISMDGSMTNYKPIEELKNGLGDEAVAHFAVIDAHIQKIRDMIGFNDITDGTTPDPKTLNGVASMAAEATNNALHHMFEAEKKILEMLAEDVAIRVHDSVAFKENSPYRYIMAPSTVKSIRENKAQIHRQFSVVLEYGSDKFEKEKLSARVEKAMDAGQITLADALVVDRCRNTKQAEQILAYRIKKNAERQAQMKQQEVLTNAKAQADAAAQAEEAKRQTLEFEYTLKLKEIERLEQKEINVLSAKYMLEAQMVHEPAQQTKKEVAEITANAAIEAKRIAEANKGASEERKLQIEEKKAADKDRLEHRKADDKFVLESKKADDKFKIESKKASQKPAPKKK